MKINTIAALIAALFCASMSSAAEKKDLGQTPNSRVEELAKRIRECPDPLDIAETNLLRRSVVLRTLLCLCNYDLRTIRAAEALITEKGSILDEAKLYVLNRCLFDVPEGASRDIRSFSGWHACHDSNGYRVLWPLAKKPDGTLVLESMNSSYMGPSYQAVEEFDYFRQKFPVRKR